jgi:hypothetical protein
MSALAQMATVLAQVKAPQTTALPPGRGSGRTAAIRSALAESGPMTARELGSRLGFPPARVGALLKYDIRKGHAEFSDGTYHLKT